MTSLLMRPTFAQLFCIYNNLDNLLQITRSITHKISEIDLQLIL
jgi:hypothetical protein